MKRMILASALALAAGIGSAQPAAGPQGPGMMGGWGHGYGMGPGMMGGYGPGWGMGPGMGPGMMGGYGPGYGMGPGMMGGYGAGMMGFGAGRALWALDLDSKQRTELSRIQDESRSRQWEVAGRMHDEMAKIRDAMTAPGKPDRAAALAAYDRMAALRRQRLEIALDTAERVDQVLTAEQREQLRRWTPWRTPRGEGPR